MLVHRPVQLFPEFGLRDGTRWQLPTRSCFSVGCDRCLNGRSGFRFQWVGQSQPPWVPSPRRLGLCSYKDNEAEARVPPLARAEEDSLASFGIGEEAHGHRKRKARRTIRRFFMNGQKIIAATTSSLVRSWPHFSVRPLSRESGIRPRKHNELSSNSDVSDTVDTGRRWRETPTSFEMERLICASNLLLQPRIR